MKTNTARKLACSALFLAAAHLAQAQFVWTNASGNYALSDSTNWLLGVAPTDGSSLIIGSSDPLGVDTGTSFNALSLQVLPGFAAMIAPFSGETFGIGGGGLVDDGLGLDFAISLNLLGTQSWLIDSGSVLLEQALSVGPGTVTINLASGTSFTFGNSSGLNPDWLGTINFTGAIDTNTIAASSLSLSSQNLSHITINGNAVTLVDGYLQVAAASPAPSAVPEPSSYALSGAVADHWQQ